MVGWNSQTYGSSPLVFMVCFHDLPAAIAPESKTPAFFEVAVWGIRSLLTQRTESPAVIVSDAGLKPVARLGIRPRQLDWSGKLLKRD